MSTTEHNKAATYTLEDDGVAIIALDMQDYPVNMINEGSMQGFQDYVEKAVNDDKVRGLVITSSRKEFMVGADLNMLLRLTDAEDIYNLTMNLNAQLRRLETCGKPVVAAINGSALGGGYELALACHHRIAIDDKRIQIGLPEVQLGVLPGGGGTQRLPRLIGLQPAMENILQAKRNRPEKAKRIGMIDDLAEDKDELLLKARKWVLDNPKAQQPWEDKKFKLPGGGVMTPQGAQVMSAGIGLLRKETWGNYPGAGYALSCIYEGSQLPIDQALDIEARYFTKAVMSKESKHMIRTLFFNLTEANKGKARPKDEGESSIKKIGMLGAGMMGAGIAYVSAKAGYEVVLKDVSQEGAEKGKTYSEKLVQKAVSRKRMSEEKAQSLLDRIHPTDKADDLKGCDLVIEAVFEDRELKAKVTQEAEAVMNENGVFASNTSTLPITGLAEASSRPTEFIGLHFFSPVDKMPLVEIIMGEKTSQRALAWAIDYVKTIKKTPIVVKDGRGFYTSRVFATYVNEGMELLREGCPPAMIENAGKAAGMPVGPLALADEVSISLLYHIVKQTEKDLGHELTHASAVVGKKFIEELDRPGKKAGKGFYAYPENEKKHLWPALTQHYPTKDNHPDYETMQQRLLTIQALETVRCMDEGIVAEPKDADVGSIMGWGFAPFTGGTISYIDFVGVEAFVERCERFEQAYGERFAVPASLKAKAQKGEGYY